MQHSLQNRGRLLRACVCATSLSFVVGVSSAAFASPGQQARHRRTIATKAPAKTGPAKKLNLAAEVEEKGAPSVPFCAQLSDFATVHEEGWRPDAADDPQTTESDSRPSATIVYFSKWRAKGVAARFRW